MSLDFCLCFSLDRWACACRHQTPHTQVVTCFSSTQIMEQNSNELFIIGMRMLKKDGLKDGFGTFMSSYLFCGCV